MPYDADGPGEREAPPRGRLGRSAVYLGRSAVSSAGPGSDGGPPEVTGLYVAQPAEQLVA